MWVIMIVADFLVNQESCLFSSLSLLLMQELEGDEEAEDDDDAEINPKVSCLEFRTCVCYAAELLKRIQL